MIDGRSRVLLINYDYPPGLSGVRRIVKLAQYLPEFGLHPLVLCANPDGRMPFDHDALSEVEAQGYPIFRTPSVDSYHAWERLKTIPRAVKRFVSALEAPTPYHNNPVPPEKIRKHGRIGKLFSRIAQ